MTYPEKGVQFSLPASELIKQQDGLTARQNAIEKRRIELDGMAGVEVLSAELGSDATLGACRQTER